MGSMRRVERALTRIASVPLAALIVFEEWGWEPLARLAALLARLPLLAWAERRVSALPPYAALVVFALPWLLLLPLKFAALWFIGNGQVVLGIAVISIAKLIGTAIVARLFMLTKPALLRLPWFAIGYARWRVWRDALLCSMRASRASHAR
jgi:hypothetical protein